MVYYATFSACCEELICRSISLQVGFSSRDTYCPTEQCKVVSWLPQYETYYLIVFFNLYYLFAAIISEMVTLPVVMPKMIKCSHKEQSLSMLFKKCCTLK